MTADQLLTPAQVSDWLQVPAATLRNWRRYPRRSGVPLPFVKAGGQVRYRRAEVEAWIEANARSTPEVVAHRRLRRGA